MMRVLVCGGRDYGVVQPGCPADPDHEHRVVARHKALLLRDTLDCLDVDRGISAIIQGGARGADALASGWARANLKPEEVYPADWERDGRAAGPIRNARMLLEGKPDLVVAFPGGRGTEDMVNKARAAGVEVMEIAG